jgi:cell shape-determining protein MreD
MPRPEYYMSKNPELTYSEFLLFIQHGKQSEIAVLVFQKFAVAVLVFQKFAILVAGIETSIGQTYFRSSQFW